MKGIGSLVICHLEAKREICFGFKFSVSVHKISSGTHFPEDAGYLLSANDSLLSDNDDLVEDGNVLMEDEGCLVSARYSLAEANAYRFWADVSDHLKFLVEENSRINSNKPPTIRNMLLSYRTDFTLWLSPNSKQKTQGCARLTRKSYAMPTKISETRRSSSNSSNFLRRHRLFSGSPDEATL